MLEAEDIELVRDELRSKNVKIIGNIREELYGELLTFEAPNGHCRSLARNSMINNNDYGKSNDKGDLITSANGQFDKMWKLIDSMSEERQKAAFADEMATAGKETHWSRDRNLRDVLVYLYEWHQLLLRWIKAKLDGGYKTVLPEPYNWNTYPAMNVEFWKKHQSTPLTQAKRT